MAVVTTPSQLAFVQRARFAKVLHKQEEVHALVAEFGKEDFYGLTGGVITAKTLRAMGHPFAVSHTGAARGIVRGSISSFKAANSFGVFGISNRGVKGFKSVSPISSNGMVSRLPINRQTGLLQSSIQLEGPVGPKNEYSLFSSAPYAKYVLSPTGTPRMVPRGLLGPDGVLRKRHKARIQVLISMVRVAQAVQ